MQPAVVPAWPVCQRDYREVSDTPLHAHITEHIATLSKVAGDLRVATRQRQIETRVLDVARNMIKDLESRHLSDEARKDLQRNIANLEEAREALEAIQLAVQQGTELRERLVVASKGLSDLRREEKVLAGIRESVAEFPAQLGLDSPTESEGIDQVLSRCLEAIGTRITDIDQLQKLRVLALSTFREVKIQRVEIDNVMSQRAAIALEKVLVDKSFASVQATKEEGKKLATRVEEVRTDIIKRVFNNTLNELWRDLFVRLAPDEKFVPGFAIPTTSRSGVDVKLETRPRGSSVASGHPRSMLSAGNLNTAALTLFLSLHLSVKPLLPWIVIDDPVQSMDEIHTAQFAALLRSLSRQCRRQVIIAVHEKSLFDYLALELSPASQNDSLITIELSQAIGKDTIITPEIKTWNPETIFTPALSA